jgi:hypothetical protein
MKLFGDVHLKFSLHIATPMALDLTPFKNNSRARTPNLIPGLKWSGTDI